MNRVVVVTRRATPAAAFILNDPDRRKMIEGHTPLLGTIPGRPHDAAALLHWLTSADNTQLTGQVLFADSGFRGRRPRRAGGHRAVSPLAELATVCPARPLPNHFT